MLRTSSTSGISPSNSFSPNRSSLSPFQAVQGRPQQRSWLTNFLPIQAIEDHTEVLRDLEEQELEEAVEVTEKSDLDAASADRSMPLAFNFARHEELDKSEVEATAQPSWRMKERMKTVSVALVICLNVGVDPPDLTKTQPCARTECWIDPSTLNPQRAIEAIGANLQKQYERWQPKARYRQSLDPPLEEVRRLATGLRRNARDERVLFHYNGHGVPKPTANGEIWVFNRNYTQYIPLSLYDLQAWMGSPSIFVCDCSNAGIIVRAFEQFADQHEREYLEQVNSRGVSSADLPPPITQRNCIQLAACAANQILPMSPDLPADLFTSCLTTPIKMALRWFVMQKHGKLAPEITVDMLDKIPGLFGDRRTMLGELNWIFTAITDTIAWNTLPKDLFQKLFRQDLLVASLFRNFLLADRIMRSYDCTPISQPPLPSTMKHGMWKAWDHAVDISLSQLTVILDCGASYKSSLFFEEQLTAFEVWLKHGNEKRPPPEQLPIVLQVLLSQAHRLRALDLLGRFLEVGHWAVNLALSVGIFPYVLKLLQSSARELRPLLVSIWAKILAVDPSCQADLIRDKSHKYFLSVLQDETMPVEVRKWAAFIMATIVHNFQQGQQEAEQANLISICLENLDHEDSTFRQWLAIAIGRTWDKHEKARWRGARDNAHEKLYILLDDPTPEVRASSVFALGTFLNSCEERTEHANTLDHSVALHLVNTVVDDASPLVRKELVIALHYITSIFESNFITVCRISLEESGKTTAQRDFSSGDIHPNSGSSTNLVALTRGNMISPSRSSSALDRLGGPMNRSHSTAGILNSIPLLNVGGFYNRIWCGVKSLTFDPHPDVSTLAKEIVLFFHVKAKEKERYSKVIFTHQGAVAAAISVPSSPAKASFMIGNSPERNMTGHFGHRSPAIPPSIAEEKTPNSPSNVPPHQKKLGTQSHNPSPTSTQTGKDLKPPQLQTDFELMCLKHFTRQLMKHECSECDCDPESARHWNKEWLYSRNLEVRYEADYQRDWLKAKWCKLDNLVTSFKVGFSPSLVVFHPYNNQIAVAGPRTVVVQNLDTGSALCPIKLKTGRLGDNNLMESNQKSQFTALSYVNAHEHALLLAATNDGCVRVFRDEDEGESVRLVTAWNALNELLPINMRRRNVAMRMAWDQKTRVVAVGGDCNVVRLWDANHEKKRFDIPSGNEKSYVNCLSFSPSNPNLLSAGFGDGSARIFDVRSKDGRVIHYREHELATTILDCKLQDTGGYTGHFVLGSADGAIRITDPRKAPKATVRTIMLGQSLNALAIHQRAFTAAAWTISQSVSVHSLLGSGSQLNSIRNTEGLLGHRRGPVGCLSFHPHLIQLAMAPADGIVSVYNLRKTS